MTKVIYFLRSNILRGIWRFGRLLIKQIALGLIMSLSQISRTLKKWLQNSEHTLPSLDNWRQQKITNCPSCQKPLVNDTIVSVRGERLRQTCTKNLDHKFILDLDEKDQICRLSIGIDVGDKIRFTWICSRAEFFVSKIVFTEKGSRKGFRHTLDLPYFEPDLSDYPRLVQKLRTYLIFS